MLFQCNQYFIISMFSRLLLLILFVQVDGFVYSCDEVKYRLTDTDFVWNTKYAYVVMDAVDPDPEGQLNNIYMQNDHHYISFSNMSIFNVRLINRDNSPWRISGDSKALTCDQQFTVVFSSDETDVRHPMQMRTYSVQAGYFSEHSKVIVIPEVGMWLSKLSMAGEGNFTVYTGAGRGEDEERYEMQSWPCESMPDWIWYFGSVLTIEVDESCSFLFAYSSDLVHETTVGRHDRIAIMLSGRSDDLQSKQKVYPVARVKIGDEETSNTTWNMQISLDPANTGYLNVLDGRGGYNWPYKTGTYTERIFTDYFEVAWFPYPRLQSEQIWKNNEFVYIEIQVSPWNEDFLCPEGYAQVKSVDEQHWCYMMVWPIPPTIGFNFSKSMEICAESEGWLPIITSYDMQSSLESFVNMHLGNDNIWLGLICDPETNSLMWQDGQEILYDAFHNTSRVTESGFNCSSYSMNYGLEFSMLAQDNQDLFNYWRPYAPDREFAFAVCVTRSLEFSSSSVPSVDPSSAPLPVWAIILIVISCLLIIVCFVGIIIILRRRIQSLQAKVVEEQMVNKLGDPSQKSRSRYYDIANKNEWEIERLFVSIDINRKLGEGAFGSVFVGHVLAKNIPLGVGRSIAELSALTSNNDTVAVKMLHENADIQRENEFRAEIDLMKKIGYHERLVNMLACVTTSKPVLLICEYCSNGDLLEYMRTKRKFMLENPDETNSAEIITVKRQLMFAIQIAYGMEFLSTQGFIHRDLAARNIMVDHQDSCKIGDFGLARSIGVENENYQAQGGKLPLKWMSPEAIDKYFFSTATDVWSFGILLFEIVTLGGSPYAGWPATEILSRLKRGERMEKPDNCSDNLYDLMLACWSQQLSDRPTFSALRECLGDLLEDINQDDYYLKLNPKAHYYVLESNASDFPLHSVNMKLSILYFLLLISTAVAAPVSPSNETAQGGAFERVIYEITDIGIVCDAHTDCTFEERVHYAFGRQPNMSLAIAIVEEEAEKLNISARAHLDQCQEVLRHLSIGSFELDEAKDEFVIAGVRFNKTDEVLPYIAKHDPVMHNAIKRRLDYIEEHSTSLDDASKLFKTNLGKTLQELAVFVSHIPVTTQLMDVQVPDDIHKSVKDIVHQLETLPNQSKTNLEKKLCAQTFFRLGKEHENFKKIFNFLLDGTPI